METPLNKTKQSDEIFCWSCGEPIKREAVICVHCGVQVRPLMPQRGHRGSQSPSSPPFSTSLPASPKTKTAAVLLAVFLSYWTWLYTLQRDKVKFIVGVVLSVFVLFVRFGVDMYEHTPLRALWYLLPLFGLANIGLWIWSIIEASVRSRDWYESYPNR